MADIARDEVELKELTMTEEPALGILETLNNVRQKPGFAGDSNSEIGSPGLFSMDDNTSML
jgi:hypothetical protein